MLRCSKVNFEFEFSVAGWTVRIVGKMGNENERDTEETSTRLTGSTAMISCPDAMAQMVNSEMYSSFVWPGQRCRQGGVIRVFDCFSPLAMSRRSSPSPHPTHNTYLAGWRVFATALATGVDKVQIGPAIVWVWAPKGLPLDERLHHIYAEKAVVAPKSQRCNGRVLDKDKQSENRFSNRAKQTSLAYRWYCPTRRGGLRRHEMNCQTLHRCRCANSESTATYRGLRCEEGQELGT